MTKKKIIIVLLYFVILILPSFACGGSGGSLDPAGNATVTHDRNSTTYTYPPDDTWESCTYWDDGSYSCVKR